MKKERFFYTGVSTAFGDIGVIWRCISDPPQVQRICLNPERRSVNELIRRFYPDIRWFSSSETARFTGRIQRFLEGEAVDFDSGMLSMDICTPFQRQVLMADNEIPRGSVITYGNIADSIGVPGGSRAVGQALASNPFPIVIPCHRVIRANGTIGGYQGGPGMKRALLALEDVNLALA